MNENHKKYFQYAAYSILVLVIGVGVYMQFTKGSEDSQLDKAEPETQEEQMALDDTDEVIEEPVEGVDLRTVEVFHNVFISLPPGFSFTSSPDDNFFRVFAINGEPVLDMNLLEGSLQDVRESNEYIRDHFNQETVVHDSTVWHSLEDTTYYEIVAQHDRSTVHVIAGGEEDIYKQGCDDQSRFECLSDTMQNLVNSIELISAK